MTQGIEEQIGAIPTIESEGHLFEVGCEMVGAKAMPRPHDSALQQREGRFDGVGMNVSDNVDLLAVIDRLMAALEVVGLHCALISRVVVCNDHVHIGADIFSDVPCECSRLHIVSVEEAKVATTLTDANNNLLFSFGSFLSNAALFATDKRFINFYGAIKHPSLIGFHHCGADTMAEIPRCLVPTNPERALNLAGRHALLGFTEKHDSGEPFEQGQVRIVEYGARCDCELVITGFAVEQLFCGLQFDYRQLAAQAGRAFRPAETHKQLAALVFGRKHGMYVN